MFFFSFYKFFNNICKPLVTITHKIIVMLKYEPNPTKSCRNLVPRLQLLEYAIRRCLFLCKISFESWYIFCLFYLLNKPIHIYHKYKRKWKVLNLKIVLIIVYIWKNFFFFKNKINFFVSSKHSLWCM